MSYSGKQRETKMARAAVVLKMLTAVLGIGLTPALAQSVEAYGPDWYKAEFWSGEYPNGFTVLKDTTLKLRASLSPTAEKTIDCPIPAKATYQMWNMSRVLDDGLTFISFTEKDVMKASKAYDATLLRYDGSGSLDVSFKPGDEWTYLAYFGEGAFLMEYDGNEYEGDQDLYDVSEAVKAGDRGYDEWLRINCSNNQWGWLFMGDIDKDEVTFTGPNIVTYGQAADAE